MLLGAHESVAGGLHNAVTRAVADGCESLQIFVKSPNRWAGPELTTEDISAFKAGSAAFGNNIVTHSAYLINLASPKDEVRDKSIIAMKDEMARCDRIGVPYYVLHPGSPLDSGYAQGVSRIVYGIDEIYGDTGADVMLLLEGTAGMGNSIGGKLEHLEEIISKCKFADKVGICLDTCHMYVAGYDLVNKYDEIMDEVFERFGGKLKVIHLNDSKGELDSHKDRHALIGKGFIGLDTFKRFVNDSRLKSVLGVLETPVDDNYADEIKLLKSLRV